MTAPLAAGLAVGAAWAAADALLLRYAAGKAARAPGRAGTLLLLGFGARWLLTLALIALAFCLPQLDPVGIVAPLIVQKLLLALLSALPRGKGGKEGEDRND